MKNELSVARPKQSQFADYLEQLVNRLAVGFGCDFPNELQVRLTEMHASVTLTIQAHPRDHGLFVGGGGVMVNALEAFFGLIGLKENMRINFVLLNPKGWATMQRPLFRPDPNWTAKKIEPLVETLFLAVFKKEFQIESTDDVESTTYEIVTHAGDPMLAQVVRREEVFNTILRAVAKAQGRNRVFLVIK